MLYSCDRSVENILSIQIETLLSVCPGISWKEPNKLKRTLFGAPKVIQLIILKLTK